MLKVWLGKQNFDRILPWCVNFFHWSWCVGWNGVMMNWFCWRQGYLLSLRNGFCCPYLHHFENVCLLALLCPSLTPSSADIKSMCWKTELHFWQLFKDKWELFVPFELCDRPQRNTKHKFPWNSLKRTKVFFTFYFCIAISHNMNFTSDVRCSSVHLLLKE